MSSNLARQLLTLACKWLLALLCGLTMICAGAYLYLSPKLPDKHTYTNIRLETPLKIYSSDNKLLAEFGSRRSNPVPLSQIPTHIINAFIASEDKRFYDHNGVDYWGLVRAIIGILLGQDWGGGSSITMQVTKNFFFETEPRYSRWPKEILLSIKMEHELSKQEILELYINRTFFGISAYGISAAAKQYFDKEITELTLAETATLIGIMPAPNSFNPIKAPERAQQERNRVLRRMRDQDMITETEYQEAVASAETARRYGRQPELEAPYVAELARQEVVSRFGERALLDGFEVYTTVDSKMQIAANKALNEGLEHYDRTHGYRGPESRRKLPAGDNRSALMEILGRVSPVADQYPAVVTTVDEHSFTVMMATGRQAEVEWDNMKWARSASKGTTPRTPKDIVSSGDLLRVTLNSSGHWALGQVPSVNGSLVSLNPNNGAIMALVGGYDFNASSFNRVTQAKRQPGSNFKPFLYSSALDHGYTAATLINDAPLARSDYRPENFGGDFLGPIRLKYALTQSKNLVSLRLYDALGQDTVLPYIARFGFKEKDFPRDDLTIAIGSHAVMPLEVATGYTVFANGGYKVAPYLIDRVVNINDGEVYRARPATVCHECPDPGTVASATTETATAATSTAAANESKSNPVAPRVLDVRTAYIMNSILKAVTTEGSARAVDRAFDRNDLAGKTGTTNDATDLWFSGFNADVEATIYVGFDQPQSLGGNEQASSVALPIWIDYMKAVLAGKPENSMRQPDGIATARINSKTGLRALPGDPEAIYEVFKAEELPPYPEGSDPAKTPTARSKPPAKEESLF